MAGFHHMPNQDVSHAENAGAGVRARYGLILFAVYLVLYGGFVLLNAFAPQQMEQTPFLGVNLAVLSGFALILAALLLALLYGWLCRGR